MPQLIYHSPPWCCRYKNLLSLSLGLVGIEGAVVHSGDLHERQSLHNLDAVAKSCGWRSPRLKEMTPERWAKSWEP